MSAQNKAAPFPNVETLATTKAPPLLDRLAELAQHSGTAAETAAQTLREAAAQQRPLIAAILDEKNADETQFLRAVSDWLRIPWREEPLAAIAAPLREKFPPWIALRHHLFPARLDENGLVLVTYDPFNLTARQAVAQAVTEKITWEMSTRRQILQGLRQGYGVGAETFEQLLEGREEGDAGAELKQETNVLDSEDTAASVVTFVNQIIREALREHATDIHVEPLENDLRIRFRIDGVLHETPVPANIRLLQASFISRLKIMANLNIAERRLPQDGRINLELEGRPIDVRVATIPSVTGESISLRLLGQQEFNFSSLGLDSHALAEIKQLLAMPNGIVLLTGPTGCGKSTTLYTFLSSLNTKERRIVTIEDPVEHKLPGVIQIAVKPEIDLTFATALRSILRGDPNVIMVGEMRDFETAEIAIRAALTGHLVFSTLHTNDAIGGITRLIDMGVEPFLVTASVRAFIAQRLVRVLCPDCKQPAHPSEEYLSQIGFPPERAASVMKPAGCERCRHTGYAGRTAVFEICMVTPKLQEAIIQRKPAAVLRATAIEESMIPLRQFGWLKVADGTTTIDEVLRVTTADDENTE
jgi:general secretion pathway protein E/type IV pilus assembly protein PilB